MLARTFLSATELDLTDDQYHAFKIVLFMFEQGEIPSHKFYMGWTGDLEFWQGKDCNTPACILGWARHVMAKPALFPPCTIMSQTMQDLFFMGSPKPLPLSYSKITPEMAARVLNHYLTTGEVEWSVALS